MFIVFLMMGSFALAFAELVRKSDALSSRDQGGAMIACGEATSVPCQPPPARVE